MNDKDLMYYVNVLHGERDGTKILDTLKEIIAKATAATEKAAKDVTDRVEEDIHPKKAAPKTK